MIKLIEKSAYDEAIEALKELRMMNASFRYGNISMTELWDKAAIEIEQTLKKLSEID